MIRVNQFVPRAAWTGVVLLGLAGITFGQQNSGSKPKLPASQTAQSADELQAQMQSGQRQLVKEEREAAGADDETAQFKYSAPVRAIAKLTGLDLEKAYWLCVVLNFAIIAGLVMWAWKKNVPAMFRNRTAAIQKAMQDARAASEDGRRRLAQVEARLAKLDGEIAQLTANAEKEAVAEEERIKTAAAEDGRKIVQTVEQEIAAAAKNARRELTAYAADLAVGLAAKQVRVDAATDQALVSDFSRQLAGSGSSRKDGSA